MSRFRRNEINVGVAGIALTYALGMIPVLEWFVQFTIDVESRMNMVERLMVGANPRCRVSVCVFFNVVAVAKGYDGRRTLKTLLLFGCSWVSVLLYCSALRFVRAWVS